MFRTIVILCALLALLIGMQRYRSYGQRDEAPLKDGDDGFIGTIMRGAADKVPPGHFHYSENYRFEDREAVPRKGITKPGWLNKTDTTVDNKVRPFGTIYGRGVFKDPNSRDWVLMAADGYVYRCIQNNQIFSLPMPPGVVITSNCTFTQAFNKVYMFRGKYLKPLRMSDIDDGFEDIVTVWNAATDYTAGTEVAYGPFITLSSLTSDGGLATAVTPTAHGYITGADISIIDATETEYNGRFNITVIDDVTFTFNLPSPTTSPATGTPKCSNMIQYWSANSGGNDPGAGESPVTHSAKWTRVHNIIPNADFALFINNRLLIPTALTPGVSAYDNTSTYTKVDFVVVTEIADEIHFSNSNFFRINQGSSDEIVDMVKFNDNDVVIFKGSSWGVLGNVNGSLSGINFDLRSETEGLVARGAVAVNGQQLYFCPGKRGVVSMTQSEQSKIMGVADVPLSADIQPLIDRINWGFGHKIRMTIWDNKLYMACPLNNPRYPMKVMETVDLGPTGQQVIYFDLIPEKTYWFETGSDGAGYQIESGFAIVFPDMANSPPMEFRPTFTTAFVSGVSEPYTGLLYSYSVEINYAVLVYDFVNQRWTPMDQGQGIWVKEWFQAPYMGVSRLFFCGEDGWNNLYEESTHGDQVESSTTDDGVDWVEIETRAKTRGYKANTNSFKRGRRGEIILGTWRPSYSITQHNDGVNENRTVATNVTRSRTRYFKPFDRPDWDPTNANNDHGTKYREDYSVELPVQTESGVALELYQETIVRFNAPNEARFTQFEMTNTQGRLVIKAVEFEAVEGQRRSGKLV